jgi:hypothetical protein
MTPGEQEGMAWGLPVQVVYGLRIDHAAQPFRLAFTLVAWAQLIAENIHRAVQGEPPVHLIPVLAE